MSRFFHGILCKAAPLALTPVLALLAACGGGGGGGEVPVPPPPTISSLVITSDNQKAVAADALDSATDISLAAFSSTLIAGGAQLTGTSVPATPVSLASLTLQLVGHMPASATALGVAVNLSLPCKSGSGTVSGEVARGGSLTAGDAMTFTTNNCVFSVDGVDSTMNGSIFVRVTGGSFDVNHPTFPVSLVFSIVATNFSVAFQDGGQTTNGDQQVTLNRTGDTAATEALTGAAITVNVTTKTGTHVSTLKNYRLMVTEDGTEATVDATATVETENTQLGKVSYQLSTPMPMAFEAGAILSGSMWVAGRGSALLVTGTGNDNLTLQVDENGDGIYETTTPTTGSELSTILARSAGLSTPAGSGGIGSSGAGTGR